MVLDQQVPNRTTRAIREAFRKGYRVSDLGKLYNPKGEVIKHNCFDKYLKFTVHGIEGTRFKSVSVPVHRFAAYCFYGEELFHVGVVVRHLDDNKIDYSKRNIALGSPRDNINDIPYEIRKKRCDYARGFQGRPNNARFSDAEVREIRRRLNLGESGVVIASKYNVTPRCISGIRTRRSYSSVV